MGEVAILASYLDFSHSTIQKNLVIVYKNPEHFNGEVDFLLNNKIKTFRQTLTKGNIIGYFFVALFGGLPIFFITLQKMGNIISAIQMLIFFTIFFHGLILFALFIDLKGQKRIIVFSNGISSFNTKTNKRIEMTFDEMIGAKIVDLSFGDKFIVVQSNKTDEELLIPYPIKRYDDFLTVVSNLAGKNNVLASRINEST